MLNILWPIFIIISYAYSLVSGNLEKINNGIFESASSAVELTITFFGTITLWCGIMQIAKDSGLSKKLAKLLKPIVKFLFPDVSEKDSDHEEISLNIIANILGLGNASTPLGLKAMESLQRNNPNKNVLSNSMSMLVLVNTASLQLIPTTVIAIRMSLNSNNPTAIILPVWIATLSAAFVAVFAAKLCIKFDKRRNKKF
ncbi:MAG: hypothetical protein HFJ51_07260 [Clostridia bacterium]|nr:hypothetical protein [Clostridia bacterium]